jgi:hypothetical protein
LLVVHHFAEAFSSLLFSSLSLSKYTFCSLPRSCLIKRGKKNTVLACSKLLLRSQWFFVFYSNTYVSVALPAKKKTNKPRISQE